MSIPFLFSIAFAIYCAWQDANDIKMGISIDHTEGWVMRAVVVLAFIACAVVFCNSPWWHIGVAGVGCAFLFSVVFRPSLNKMKGEWWWYMGPRLDYRDGDDSWYDTKWHQIAWKLSGGKDDDEGYANYRDELPGILATITEVVIATVCVIVVL